MGQRAQAGAGVRILRQRYRWEDRCADLERPRSSWAFRIEAALLAGAMLFAAVQGIAWLIW